ncbi:MAG: ribosomal S17-domain-containing protein, partial [Olpidium bornovanus]
WPGLGFVTSEKGPARRPLAEREPLPAEDEKATQVLPARLTLDFQTNKKICDEVAIIASKRVRNKIAGFTTHLVRVPPPPPPFPPPPPPPPPPKKKKKKQKKTKKKKKGAGGGGGYGEPVLPNGQQSQSSSP